MENFTIHIFGYGETQINSKDLTLKVSTYTLTNVQLLIDVIFAKKPVENTTEVTDFHTINIFNYIDIRWISKTSFSIKGDTNIKSLIDVLIAELETKKVIESTV